MSNLWKMSFGEFQFPQNPVKLTIEDEMELSEQVLPYTGTRVQAVAQKKRRASGEAYLTGEDCWQQWEKLQTLYRKKKADTLCLPGQQPFSALFTRLKLLGAAGENLIQYGFTFVECTDVEEILFGGVFSAQAGESLWDYAERFSKSVDELVQANPQIRDIACLSAGERVVIPC